MKLLSRDDFRNGVFKRDNNCCVVCGNPAVDAHHLIERKLFKETFEFGGYFLDNGVSLCEEHHIEAEKTTVTVEELRRLAGISNIIIPDHFHLDQSYDKWGNPCISNGTRLKGEMFNTEQVQKILESANLLDIFSKYVKYPRTYHLPWSRLGKDDRMLKDDSVFNGKRVICSIKKDGEATSMYDDYFHARSINGNSHPSQDYVKMLWGNIRYMIDPNMRLCGENLYAKHSIEYTDLMGYFYLYSVWIDNTCLSWDETKEYAELFGFPTVEVIYDGIYDKNKILEAFAPFETTEEGYVIRLADSFDYFDFKSSIAKYVRPEFKQIVDSSDVHWMSKKVEPNKLKK